MSRRPDVDPMWEALKANPVRQFLQRLESSGFITSEAKFALEDFDRLFMEHWRAQQALEAIVAAAGRVSKPSDG